MECYVEYVAKVCYAAIFILSGINHFTKLEGMTQYAQSKNVPSAKLMVLLTGAILLFGGLSAICGCYFQYGGPLLIGFLILSAVKMHNFWAVTDPMAKAGEMASFMKNISLAGATYLIYCGACKTCAM